MELTVYDKLNIMIAGLEKWLSDHDYNYYQCNDVPTHLFSKNHYLNVFFRTFFRMSPVNFRINDKAIPLTPQGIVSQLKAYTILNNEEIVHLLFKRALKIRSNKAKYFALKQGTKISIRLYENSEEDPTPLNTVWFGQALLDDTKNIIDPQEKEQLLFSISEYLIYELGYKDYYSDGVYFFYGPTLKKEILNASAEISSFLLRVGKLYKCQKYIELGERGIKFLISKQNQDGSWFYAEAPERKSIDNFHQGYILKALYSSEKSLPFNTSIIINSGLNYYINNLFYEKNEEIIPIRYDKRFIPINTWILQKVDARDISTALEIFSKYSKNKKMVDGLINFTYNNFFNSKNGSVACETSFLWKNKIPYIEFQGWMLYSLLLAKKNIYL